MQGRGGTPHPEAPYVSAGSVRENLIDLRIVTVRVAEFGHQCANFALTPIARILCALRLTDDLSAGHIFNNCPLLPKPVGVERQSGIAGRETLSPNGFGVRGAVRLAVLLVDQPNYARIIM